MQTKLFGTLVAGAVAGLVYAGAAMADGSGKAPAKKHDAKGVKCEASTKCSGKGECSTATNDCKGKNGCSGQGWTTAKNDKECKKAQEANKKKEG